MSIDNGPLYLDVNQPGNGRQSVFISSVWMTKLNGPTQHEALDSDGGRIDYRPLAITNLHQKSRQYLCINLNILEPDLN